MRLLDLLERDNLSHWFGNSVVVDGNGKPLVVFHGTNQDIKSFNGMVWGSVDAELAHDYANMRGEFEGGAANIMPLYMKIEKPFNADHLPKTVTIGDIFMAMLEQAGYGDGNIPDKLRHELSVLADTVTKGRYEEGSGPHYARHDFWNHTISLFGSAGADAIERAFKLLGYDGIQMIEDGGMTYGAFSPNQVKSIYNRGTYSDDANVSEEDDMRLNDLLNEAPIGDYAPIGNWGDKEKSNSFNHANDRKIIQSENLVKKVRKKFGNTDHILNFYFVNLPGVRKNAEHGFMSPEELAQTMPEAWKLIQEREQEQGTDASESINVIFVGNAGANRVPMTAWIMAHRIGHALKHTNAWKDFMDDFNHTIADMMNNVYGTRMRRTSYGGYLQGMGDLELSRFFEAIGTMASARNGKLGGRPGEFYYEMFAQHITTGNLRMREMPKSFGSRNQMYHSRDEETREMYNDDLTFEGYSMVDQWGERIENVLYEATGKYVVM